MNNRQIKSIAVMIIFLFIGVALAPSINVNVVKASTDNDLIEVTSQACGISGFGNQTVKLTKQQYQNLEQYLVDFRARLNQTTTRKEAVPIFKEAVVELDKYGLLPRGMSVVQSQRLVTGLYQNTRLLKYLEKLSNKSETSLAQEGNILCLIYGKAQGEIYFQGPISRAIYVISYNKLFFIPLIISFMSYFLSETIRDFPQIGSIIYYGRYVSSEYWDYFPAIGNIWTIGAFGIKHWKGSFFGELPVLPLEVFYAKFFPGANGFTGLRLYFLSSDFYFGSALSVNVGTSPP